MHGISHLLSHHNSHNGDTRTVHHHHHQDKSSSASDTRHHDTKILQELLNHKHIQKQISRGSVSSTYSYGSSTSYGSSHGSNSSNHSSSHHHGIHHHSVYHTIHGSSHHHQSIHHHHPLHHVHQLHPPHPQHHQTSSGRASPTSPSPTGDHEKPHHHHHYSIQEMIRHFGRRLGHIRRQSECQDPPRKKEEDFRNRSQSLDGGARYPTLREADCETTYRIYESILRQGALRRSSLDPGARRFSLGTPAIPHRASDACLDPVHAAILFRDARGEVRGLSHKSSAKPDLPYIEVPVLSKHPSLRQTLLEESFTDEVYLARPGTKTNPFLFLIVLLSYPINSNNNHREIPPK
ncbi:hypothetical protein WN48_06394 [Eufriesea mexicana]|uniref:Uncharacterized protein n=1 Tax=Eufriesea mexicana TaxID=516756 RepID=A0A310SC24_9HYME|nr:hypothetical protein WN48_06394 [Eufriesea mexicana]